jgi:triosephosphate isomerase
MIKSEDKVIVANWKMNGSTELLKSFANLTLSNNKVIICPPHTLINKSKEILSSEIYIGAQNCSEKESGAFTGEVSPDMLFDVGARFVILGHSERRTLYHEVNELISQKVELALRNGLTPILCVGETLEEKTKGFTGQTIKKQLQESIPRNINHKNLLIAYEPVWAIGTGLIPKLIEIEEILQLIKNYLSEDFKISYETLHVLYGGSANSKNCKEILSLKSVDGLLVGGASLKVDEFTKISHS